MGFLDNLEYLGRVVKQMTSCFHPAITDGPEVCCAFCGQFLYNRVTGHTTTSLISKATWGLIQATGGQASLNWRQPVIDIQSDQEEPVAVAI